MPNSRQRRASRRREIENLLRLGANAAGFTGVLTVTYTLAAPRCRNRLGCTHGNATGQCPRIAAITLLPASTGVYALAAMHTPVQEIDIVAMPASMENNSFVNTEWSAEFKRLCDEQVASVVWNSIECIPERELADLIASFSIEPIHPDDTDWN